MDQAASVFNGGSGRQGGGRKDMAGKVSPTFILLGDRKYHFLIAENCKRVRAIYPDTSILVFDCGFTPSQVAALGAGGVTVVDWRPRMEDPETLRATLSPEQLSKLTLAFNARRTGLRKRFRKFMLKRFPRSKIVSGFVDDAVLYESICMEKIRCLRHASDVCGAAPMVFLDADAILFAPIDEAFAGGADVTVTLIDGQTTRQHNHCFVLNAGVLFFGAGVEARNAFLDAWRRESLANHEWLREQTALVRVIEREAPDVFEAWREAWLRLDGRSVHLRVVPCHIYNFCQMENVDPESFPAANIYHFTGRRQQPETFRRLLHFLDRRHRPGPQTPPDTPRPD